MNNHKLRELARQAGFNVDSDGNISLYGGGCKLLLRPNYQATVADGIKLLVDLAIKEERNAWENKLKEQKSKCNPHPKAPHGFNRNASHANDRYTCECEGWDAYDAGYQAGVMAGIEASMGEPKEPEQEPVASEMTAHRAVYFMERFRHEEKLLGPNEQAALEFVISMLEAQPPQRKPLTFEQVEDCFPEGPSVFEDAYGDNYTSPRWLHAFARSIEAAHGIKE